MTKANDAPAPRRPRGVRGASFVEYLVIVALAVGSILVGARALGAGLHDKSGKLGDCIRSLDGNCAGDTSSLGSAAANGSSGTTGSAAPPADPKADSTGATSSDPSAAVTPDPGAAYDSSEAGRYGADEPPPENYDTKKEAKVPGTLFVKSEGQSHAVSPADVAQGQLGDCWFMSSMAAVASRSPNAIQSNFKTNKNGTVSVRIFDGENKSHWQKVDTKFPVDDKGNVAYAQPVSGDKKGAELWVMTYERAMAKSAGGYTAIDGGDPGAGMAMITGQPSQYMRTGDTKFGKFAEYYDHGYAMAAGTPDEKHATHELFKNDTLVSGHAYWVDSVDRKAQTVTVRNPWGYDLKPITLPWATFQKVFPDAMANPIYDRTKKS
ncbi:MAG: peptidase calpain [Labilithrix sp.]|nr:peptidase calpain [Labilithrix sp.]